MGGALIFKEYLTQSHLRLDVGLKALVTLNLEIHIYFQVLS